MEKLNRLDTVPNQFLNAVERILPELYGNLISTLNLELENGRVARTQANMQRVLTALDGFQSYILNPERSPYFQTVSNFMGEFDVQKELNNQMLAAFGSIPTASEVVYAASRRQAVNLLIGDHMTSQFVGALRETLIESVSTRRSYTDMVEALSEVVNGNAQRDGRLLNWTKQVAHDSFAMTDAAYSSSAAQELGVEWWSYIGGLIDDSRCFCVQRNGGYYHTDEIRQWGNLEDIGACRTDNGWAGRMPNTDAETIFVKRGGYRCQHSFIPVSESVVPQSAIDRWKAKFGN